MAAWTKAHARLLVPVAAVAVLAFGLGAAAGRRGWPWHWEWGSVPDWIGGLGTAAAFGFAAWVYWRDLRQRRLEESIAQARLVDAWVDLYDRVKIGTSDHFLWLPVVLRVSNASSQTVRLFTGTVYFGDIEVGGHAFFVVVPPTAPGRWVEWKAEMPLIIPEDRPSPVFTTDEGPGLLGALSVAQWFIDASDNTWSRNTDGQLRFCGPRDPMTISRENRPGRDADA